VFLHHRIVLFVLFAGVILSAIAWQSVHPQASLRRITNTPEAALNLNPSLSGDGRVIGFESTADITSAADADSFRSLRANVADDPASFAQMGLTRGPAPGISQDGSRISFASRDNPLGTNPDGNSEIFLYDGERLLQITNTSPGDTSSRIANGNFQPSLSDDGRFIAFSSNRDLANQNADGNLEIFVYDNLARSFSQTTNSAGIVGSSDARISGDGSTLVYLHDSGQTSAGNRRLVRQNRQTLLALDLPATNTPGFSLAYGRALSDDGLRVVWSAETGPNSTQVFLYDGRNDQTRQITALGSRAADVALQPTISGDGTRIAFATRRSFLGNTDGGVDLYTYDIPSATFARVTSGPASATAEVVSSLSDDGSVVAFTYPRVLSGPVSRETYENNPEVYLAETPPRPSAGSLTILNRASTGHEAAAIKAVAPDSIAVATGSALALASQQAQRQVDGTFPTKVRGTTVTVNGQLAQILFVSPAEVHFLIPGETILATADVVVTNSDGFQSRGSVTLLRAAPGVFTKTGDGLGAGIILNADTMASGPFNPSGGNLRLVVFATGVRNGATVSVTAGGRALTLDSIGSSNDLPGLDELHLLVPADLRGAGLVELVVRADGRDSNLVTIEFNGDPARDLLINEFMADPPGTSATDFSGDANRDGVRDASDDEFVELVNTTSHDIDLSGFRLLSRGGTATSDTLRHVFAVGTILNSCSAAVVFGDGNSSFNPNHPAFGGALVAKASTGSLTLSNSSGVITLADETGAILSLVAYGGATGLNANNGQSLTRAPDVTGKFAPHLTGGNGLLFSPGARLNGAPFSACTPAIARIEVSPPAASINIGVQQQFTARALDAGHNEVTGVIFSWQSSDTSVVTISQNGLATGQLAGTAEIRVAGRGVPGIPAQLTVTQPPPVLTSVSISPTIATIGASETQEFVAQARDQFGQNISGVNISFSSNNSAAATVSFGPTSAFGSAIATAQAHRNGTTEIRASATDGATTVSSSAATLTVEPDAHELLLSKFRTRGPGGAADEFIEIYNPTSELLMIGGLRLRASNGSGTISDRATIAAGTTLGAGCHYLFANSSASGFSNGVTPNQTYGTGITDDGGIAINGANGTRIIDAVGLSSGSGFKEGDPLAPMAGNVDQSYERKPGGTFGNGSDTDNNASDFTLTTRGNPRNSASQCLDTTRADLSIVQLNTPNPVTVGAQLIYTLTVTNNGVAAARNLTVADELPAEVTFVSCAATGGGICGGSGRSRSVQFAALASGASVTITLVVLTDGPAGRSLTNTATVDSDTLDAKRENNTATTTTLLQAPLPALSINDVASLEGNAGTTIITFTVSLSAPAPPDGVTFDLATQDNTATSGSGDYGTKSLPAQTITSGNSSYTFDVIVNGDLLVEADETFFVNAVNVANATVLDGQGQGTIRNDDMAQLVLSQVYAGGGNTGAPFANDFVELFNRGSTTVSFAVTPYSLQYAGATATFGSSKLDLTSGMVEPGQYFLVRLASGGVNGAPLPAADAVGSIAMAATAGKVALVSGTEALGASGCPLAARVADFVGYGSTADCFEGSGRAPTPSNTAADLRQTGGCKDTGNNSTDFFVSPPFPRNTSSALNDCLTALLPTLKIDDVVLSEGDSGTKEAMFTVSLSASANGPVTFDIVTEDNTATVADNDYIARSLTSQTIPAGSVTYLFAVTVNGDPKLETDETFFVNLSNVFGASVADAQGAGTIQNDDRPALSINDVVQSEGNAGTTTFTFTVTSSLPAPPGGIMFDIATSDGSAEDDTPASEDNDYVAKSLTPQSITEGNTSCTFAVTVNGDTLVEPNETFFVNLMNATNASITDAQGQATIQNDDTAALVINQVYGGGGNASATYRNDFIELFNRGTTTVDFAATPYSVQYAAASSSFSSNKTDITAGLLLPGHYFLIQEGSGGASGVALPTPDTSGNINLAATAGKVALVLGTTTLTGSGCPLLPTVVDFLGYGTTANCFEIAPISVSGTNSNARSVVRIASCVDSNNNSTDFSNPTTPPVARNTATAATICP
jgi:uncharacterized protein (TIGR03437 family)